MPSTLLAFIGFSAASLVSADISITVQHDATYLIPDSHGVPCSGEGAEPTGTCCPKAGDIAATDCQTYLPSYNGSVCVAPVDAECVLVTHDTWGCAFLHMENYKTLEEPLHVNCEVASDEPMGGDMTFEHYDGMSGKMPESAATTTGYYGTSTTEMSMEHPTTSDNHGYATKPESGSLGYNHPITTEAGMTESDKTYSDYSIPTTDTVEKGDAVSYNANVETTKEYGTIEEGVATTSHEMTGGMTLNYGMHEDGHVAGYDKGTMEHYKPDHMGYDMTTSYKSNDYHSPTETAELLKDIETSTESSIHYSAHDSNYKGDEYHSPTETAEHVKDTETPTENSMNYPAHDSSYKSDEYHSPTETAELEKDTETPPENYSAHEAVGDYSIKDAYSTEETIPDHNVNDDYLSKEYSSNNQTEEPCDSEEPKENTMASYPSPVELPAQTIQLPLDSSMPYDDSTQSSGVISDIVDDLPDVLTEADDVLDVVSDIDQTIQLPVDSSMPYDDSAQSSGVISDILDDLPDALKEVDDVLDDALDLSRKPQLPIDTSKPYDDPTQSSGVISDILDDLPDALDDVLDLSRKPQLPIDTSKPYDDPTQSSGVVSDILDDLPDALKKVDDVLDDVPDILEDVDVRPVVSGVLNAGADVTADVDDVLDDVQDILEDVDVRPVVSGVLNAGADVTAEVNVAPAVTNILTNPIFGKK